MPEAEQEARRLGYEPNDLNVGRLLGVAGLVLAVLITVLVVAYWVTGDLRTGGRAMTSGAGEAAVPPSPRLLQDPQVTLKQHRAAKRALLSGYGWVDRDQGLVRIPIERAMELVAQRAQQQQQKDGS